MPPRDAERRGSWSASVSKTTRSGVAATRWTQSEQAAPCSRSGCTPLPHDGTPMGSAVTMVLAGRQNPGEAAARPRLGCMTEPRCGLGMCRRVREVCPVLAPHPRGPNSERRARLFLDGLAHVEEPPAMQVCNDEDCPPGRPLYVQSLCVSELVLATGG